MEALLPTKDMAPWADLLRLLYGLAVPADPACMALVTPSPLHLWRMRRDAVLLQEGAEAQSVFVVRSGSFKCVKTGEDGYEQVLFFAQAGDVLGFEALYAGRQPVTVVALEVATAYALPARDVTDMGLRSAGPGPALQSGLPAVLHLALHLALSRQMGRVAQVTEMTAAVSADARLARFLVWMSQRMLDIGQSPRSLLLRMGRRDIASLLAVAHETVSRSFTTLADAGYIDVHNRDVDIRNLQGLRDRARCTRGLPTAVAAPAAPALSTKPIRAAGLGAAAMPNSPALCSWPDSLTTRHALAP